MILLLLLAGGTMLVGAVLFMGRLVNRDGPHGGLDEILWVFGGLVVSLIPAAILWKSFDPDGKPEPWMLGSLLVVFSIAFATRKGKQGPTYLPKKRRSGKYRNPGLSSRSRPGEVEGCVHGEKYYEKQRLRQESYAKAGRNWSQEPPAEPESSQAILTLHGSPNTAVQGFKIQVDGHFAGWLYADQPISLAVTAGRHAINVTGGGAFSGAEKTVHLRDGENAVFIIGYTWRGGTSIERVYS